MPAVSGASGPTTVRPTLFCLANLMSRGKSVGGRCRHSRRRLPCPRCPARRKRARPAGLALNFQASACSRPPLPITSTFMVVRPQESKNETDHAGPGSIRARPDAATRNDAERATLDRRHAAGRSAANRTRKTLLILPAARHFGNDSFDEGVASLLGAGRATAWRLPSAAMFHQKSRPPRGAPRRERGRESISPAERSIVRTDIMAKSTPDPLWATPPEDKPVLEQALRSLSENRPKSPY